MNLQFFHPIPVVFFTLFVWTTVLPGCASGTSRKDAPSLHAHSQSGFDPLSNQVKETGREVFGKSTPGKPALGASPAQAVWSIVIASAEDPALAALALAKVRAEGGLPEAYLEKRGKATVVAYGEYDGPSSPSAKRDLDRIHNLSINGATPFATAILAPPPFENLPGAIPEYDLSTVKQRMGKTAVYTLQVAAYTRTDGRKASPQDLAEFRASAEKAAVELRREGDEAYYYHGLHGSMVTVGVFSDKDIDAKKPGPKAFQITELKKKHPLNLVNGAGVKVRVKGQTEAKLQPSQMVSIPG